MKIPIDRRLALSMLGLEEGASSDEIERAYWAKCAELEDRVHIAPTADLKQIYREALEKLEDVRAAALEIDDREAPVDELSVSDELDAASDSETSEAEPDAAEESAGAGDGSVAHGQATLERGEPGDVLTPGDSNGKTAELLQPQAPIELRDPIESGGPEAEAPVDPEAEALGSGETEVGFFEGNLLLDRFEVRRRLGFGRTGAVYAAYDRSRQREVALRIILPRLLRDGAVRERFLAEAKIAALLSHPHIAEVFEVLHDRSLCVVSMELIAWRSLRTGMEARMRAGRPYGMPEVRRVVGPLCEALQYAHKHIVHGDVRPENVFIGAAGEVKLSDFAVSSLLAPAGGQREAFGSPYTAPEHQAERMDRRSDQYAVAAIAYEMLTGRPPELPPKPLALVRKDVDLEISIAIERALRERAEERFGSIEELGRALGGGRAPRAFPLGWMAAGAAGLAAVLLIATWQWRRGVNEEQRAVQWAQSEAARIATQAQVEAARAATVRAAAEAERLAASAAQAEAERIAAAAQADRQRVATAAAHADAVRQAEAEAARGQAVRASATRAAAELSRAAEESRQQAERASATRIAADAKRTVAAEATVVAIREATAGARAEAERAATRQAQALAEANRQATVQVQVEVARAATARARSEIERAEAARREATALARPGYVPSLNATVQTLRFFEKAQGEQIAEGQRQFADRFKSSNTRTVAWELSLAHPPAGRQQRFTIRSICYAPDGSIFGQGELSSYVEANWGKSTHVYGWGFQEPGLWQTGTYRVELFIDGRKVAAGSFKIYAGFGGLF